MFSLKTLLLVYHHETTCVLITVPLTYNVKSGNFLLLKYFEIAIYQRYFERTFKEMFLELSSMLHKDFVQTTEFDGCYGNRNIKFAQKKNQRSQKPQRG